MKLYHFPPSTCSQKVRVALAEKGVAFESHLVNLLAGEQHAPDYVKLNPAHVVPTMVVDGVVLRESSLINEFIDDHCEGPALRSSDSFERYQSSALVRYVDLQIHGKVSGVPTHAILTRGLLADRTPEQLAAYLAAIPDSDERALRASLLTHGVTAPEMLGSLNVIAQFIVRLESRLGDEREWLSGEAFGLADAGVLPYVVRFRDLGLDAFWQNGASPRLADWIERSTARPSFKEAFTKWMPAEMAAAFVRLAAEARPALKHLIHSAIAAVPKD